MGLQKSWIQLSNQTTLQQNNTWYGDYRPIRLGCFLRYLYKSLLHCVWNKFEIFLQHQVGMRKKQVMKSKNIFSDSHNQNRRIWRATLGQHACPDSKMQMNSLEGWGGGISRTGKDVSPVRSAPSSQPSSDSFFIMNHSNWNFIFFFQV